MAWFGIILNMQWSVSLLRVSQIWLPYFITIVRPETWMFLPDILDTLLQMEMFQCVYFKWDFSRTSFSRVQWLVENKESLINVMAWCWPGEKANIPPGNQVLLLHGQKPGHWTVAKYMEMSAVDRALEFREQSFFYKYLNGTALVQSWLNSIIITSKVHEIADVVSTSCVIFNYRHGIILTWNFLLDFRFLE